MGGGDDGRSDDDDDTLGRELLQASQQEYLFVNHCPIAPLPVCYICRARFLANAAWPISLYHDELLMTERHLDALIDDADQALKVLESLCSSFRAVDSQTSSFKAQCDGLLTEKMHFETLAESVGMDLQYYTYLDSATRRLNAPGSGRLVEGGNFAEILSTLDSCIEFMTKNVSLTR